MSNMEIIRTPAIVAAEINQIKDQTRNIVLFNSIEIGRRLLEAKEMLPHGEFSAWLADSVDYSQRTANNLMRIFEEYGAKQTALFGDNANSQSVANLSYTQAVALLEVPQEEREAFIKDTNAAELTISKLKEAIKEHKAAREQAEAAKADAEQARDKAEAAKELAARDYDKLDAKAKEMARELTMAKNSKDLAEQELAEAIKQKQAAEKAIADSHAGSNEQLNKLEQELAAANAKVKQLQCELDRPVTVESTVVEKVPDEVQTELEQLRKAVADGESAKADLAAQQKFRVLFDGIKTDCNSLLECCQTITDVGLRKKYLAAVEALANKICSCAKEAGKC